MAEVKICGLSEPVTLDAAVAAGADHVGFIFAEGSPRQVSLERAEALAARVPGHVGRVGVFRNLDHEFIGRAVQMARLTAIQMHAPDSLAELHSLKRYGAKLWAALPVTSAHDVHAAFHYRGVADRVLFDASAGRGLRLDWRLLQGFVLDFPWGLAGGLDAENVSDAITGSRTPLVDVSSGVEGAPGVKSVAKIAAFVNAVRQS